MSTTPDDLPRLTTDQMREVDRAMIEDYHVHLIQMMENAGRNLAALARARFLGGDPRRRRVTVLAGRGGNGGGGLVCARRLHNWGADVTVFITHGDDAFEGVPARQLRTLRAMDVEVRIAEPLPDPDSAELVVDAVVGYGLSGSPSGAAADMISWAGGTTAPILSLDVPSGLDSTTGEPREPSIRATATLTLALPKTGLRAIQGAGHVGELYLADISVPPALYDGLEISTPVPPVFALEDIIRLA